MPSPRIMHSAKGTLAVFGSSFAILFMFDLFGAFEHVCEVPFAKYVQTIDQRVFTSVESLTKGEQPELTPYSIKLNLTTKPLCNSVELVIIVKSAMENSPLRLAIRDTWGISARTVFLLGKKSNNPSLEIDISRESEIYGDIVRGDFEDTYFNNTLKTLCGIYWAVNNCQNVPFYLFVDDDMFVSTKNLRDLIMKYQEIPDLYLGYVFYSSPLRQKFSKWYISVKEYPYDSWPPYVTAGAYLLNRKTLEKFYYASWFTNYFRFDDIYIAFLALHTRISPVHCSDFYFWKKSYSVPDDYRSVIASHGYSDPYELLRVWEELKVAGFV